MENCIFQCSNCPYGGRCLLDENLITMNNFSEITLAIKFFTRYTKYLEYQNTHPTPRTQQDIATMYQTIGGYLAIDQYIAKAVIDDRLYAMRLKDLRGLEGDKLII